MKTRTIQTPGNPMPHVISAGSIVLNVILFSIIIGVIIIALVFIKGGVESVQGAFSDLSQSVANFKPFG